MLLKYVELNGNMSDPIPWSIRQMLFYQKFDQSLNRESVVLFRASSTLKRRIQEEFYGNGGHVHHWTNLPLLLVSSLLSNWAEYAKFLDLAVWKIVCSSPGRRPMEDEN